MKVKIIVFRLLFLLILSADVFCQSQQFWLFEGSQDFVLSLDLCARKRIPIAA